MSYRSPFRDVADAFSGLAPNIAQGVQREADRKRQEDDWARAAAQQQSADLQKRLGELTSNPDIDPANKAQTDQQIAMISRALDMYRDVYTAQPGKAYEAWMAVSSGALSVPAVGPQAAASPRERAAGRPTTTGETMSVPELMGRSAGTVGRNLLTSEQRKIVQTSNSELVREAYQFLMSPGSIDLANPLAQEQAARILSSVSSLVALEVLPGMEQMQSQLMPLASGLRSLIMQSGTPSERLRNLAMQTAESNAERARIETEAAAVNLDMSRIEATFLPQLRAQQVDLNQMNWELGNAQLSGLQFSNMQDQVNAFMTTGLTGSPEQEAALRLAMGSVSDAEFEALKRSRFEDYRQKLVRESERQDLELSALRTNIDLAIRGDARAAQFDEARLAQMAQDLQRGEFQMDQNEWAFERDRRLSAISDATDGLAYIMQATLQGDASALNFIMREMQNPDSQIGEFYRGFTTVDEVARRYDYALTDEDLRSRDQSRRSVVSDLEYERQLTAYQGDRLQAGVALGQWAAQSMNADELIEWRNAQARAGRAVPPIEDLQLMRAAHINGLRSPVRQEIWSQIERLSSIPTDPQSVANAFQSLGALLSDPSLGLDQETIDTYLSGYSIAQNRSWTAYDLELEGARLANDLLSAQAENYRADAARSLASISQAGTSGADGQIIDQLIGDAESQFELAEAYYARLQQSVGDLQSFMIQNGCMEPASISLEFEAGTRYSVPRTQGAVASGGNADPSAGGYVDCAEYNYQYMTYQLQLEAANLAMREAQSNVSTFTGLRAQYMLGGFEEQAPAPTPTPTPTPTPAPATNPAPVAPTPTPPAPPAAQAPQPSGPYPPSASASQASQQPNAPRYLPTQASTPFSPPSSQNAFTPNPSAFAQSDSPVTLEAAARPQMSSWSTRYRGAASRSYASPEEWARAVAAMPEGSEKSSARGELGQYVFNYIVPSVISYVPGRTAGRARADDEWRTAQDILRLYGLELRIGRR